MDENQKMVHSVLQSKELSRKEASEYDFENPILSPEDMARTLANIMLKNQGIGLAAPQVGIDAKVFVIAGAEGPGTVKVFYNPKIVHYSEEELKLEEGCLTFPGLAVNVKRPKHIRLRYQDGEGNVYSNTYTGMTARIIQHEYDHLMGETMLDKGSTLDREKAKKEWKKIQKNMTPV